LEKNEEEYVIDCKINNSNKEIIIVFPICFLIKKASSGGGRHIY
jgi:hypothetical protein